MKWLDWAQNRDSPYIARDVVPRLAGAWDFSRVRIREIQTAINRHALPATVACTVASGSLCRMESHAGSDVDLLVVLDDKTKVVSEPEAMAVFEEIWRRLAPLQLAKPKPGGVFSEPVRWSCVTDPSVRGIINENLTTFGQRMQLLLDAQPVTGHDCFDRLQTEILHWYSESRVATTFNANTPFHWLHDDVQRYWYSIRSRASWLHADDTAKSMEVNVKLRSSRLILIYAFLSAIEQAHATTHEVSEAIVCMRRHLRLTPLERTAAPGLQKSQHGSCVRHCSELLNDYQTVWEFLKSETSVMPKLLEDDGRAVVPEPVLKALVGLQRGPSRQFP